MSLNGWLSGLGYRSRHTRRAPRPRGPVLRGWALDGLLEDRCLPSGGPPYEFPVHTVDSIDEVLYNGATGQYEKTITVTNNSPTQTIYAFLEGQISRLAIDPYVGTGAFDPFDPANQEYRAYIGYTDGAKNYAGLPPNSSITIPVPLAFWDSGRICFSTDGANQFASAPGAAAPGAPFYYHDVNTQAAFYGSIDAGHLDRLTFTPIYNSFDPATGYMPSTKDWKSPVELGLLKTGMTVTGPGLPGGSSTITVDPSHPGYVTLTSPATAAQGVDQYTFTSAAGESISPTARHTSVGYSLTTPEGTSANGAVMWYHALKSNIPNNDAPFQLAELTFRGTFYDPKINTTTGFQYLLGNAPGNGIDANDFDLADYDLSFVDSINLPVALEASDATIPNSNTRAPFGWVGSGQPLAAFQAALAAFASPNPGNQNVNGLGQYFGGQGYPSYLLLDQGNLKLPAGQNLFLASPVVPGGLADIAYTKTFSDGSKIQEPVYALTSAGTGPAQLSIGGDPAHPSRGQFLGLNTITLANQFLLHEIIAPNVAAGHTYNVTYNVGSVTKVAGQVVDMYRDGDNNIIGVKLDRPVPSDASTQVYTFKLPASDYAGKAIAGLWYTWANYYATHVKATPLNKVGGTIAVGSNVLTLTAAAPGLVPGMAVTGPALPAGCVVLSVAPDNKTVTLSTAATGAGNTFNFAKPAVQSIVGYDPNGFTPILPGFSFPADEAHALAFAETVYVVMSAWSPSVPAGTANAWNPLLTNIIGGNLGTNYLPNATEGVVQALTVLSKSALRGVPDYTSSLYSDPAQWYPDPAVETGGQEFNAYNLDPFVWFIHEKLGLTGYAFALDDDVGNVGAGGATHVDITVGGLNGVSNKDPYTPVSPFGVVTTQAAASPDKSSTVTHLTNPNVVYQIAQFDYPHNMLGTMVNGPGVPRGTTVQFTQIASDPQQTKLVLSQPLANPGPGVPTYSFFGPLVFTAVALGKGQPRDTLYLDSLDAYNTLLKLGPLQNIQVTGPGIRPGTTVTIKSLPPTTIAGVYQVRLSSALQPNLVSQPGESYGYTFGTPVVGPVRDAGFEWAVVQGLAGGFNHGTQVTQNTVDWTFADSTTNAAWFAGIAANGSDYTSGNPAAPQGLQVGFITGDGSISQAVTLGAGTYAVSFRAAQRANKAQTPQTVKVLIDGKPVGTVTPAGPNYVLYTTPAFTVTGGAHTITFQGAQNGDSTALLDAVSISRQ